ncbi:MAG: hypothetical protein NDJ90_15665 [Oligoflexia bacterium]|nr:hypothetical protein [Oligoflexia bacterium]
MDWKAHGRAVLILLAAQAALSSFALAAAPAAAAPAGKLTTPTTSTTASKSALSTTSTNPTTPMLIPDKAWKQTINTLLWKNRVRKKTKWGQEARIELEVHRVGKVITGKGAIHGFYGRKAWKVLVNHREVVRAANGEFVLKIDVLGPKSFIILTAIGPKGELEEQRFIISFPGFHAWVTEQQKFFNKRYFFSGTLGGSFLWYEEVLTEPLHQFALTAKLSYQYLLLPPRLDFGFTGYITAVPLTTSLAETSARFLGLNLRLGYVMPGIPDPWRVSIMTGMYYTTMLVPNDDFGFSHLMGPQLFPVIRRMLPNGDAISGYFKFSPVGVGVALESLNNREMAVGLSFTQRISTWRSISYAIDIADLQLQIDGVDIRSRSASFGVGFSW